MIDSFEINTPRLVLKSVTPHFIHNIFETRTKSEIVEYFNVDENGFLHLKEMHEKGMEMFRISLFYFILQEKVSGQIIGECGFHTWNQLHKRAELFYTLRHDDFKNKGYMKEALQKVLSHGFNSLDLHRVEALIADSNIPSKKLLLHYGFKKEGTKREDYVVNGIHEDSDSYSLLRREWQASVFSQ